jgi:hypothetical protein
MIITKLKIGSLYKIARNSINHDSSPPNYKWASVWEEFEGEYSPCISLVVGDIFLVVGEGITLNGCQSITYKILYKDIASTIHLAFVDNKLAWGSDLDEL